MEEESAMWNVLPGDDDEDGDGRKEIDEWYDDEGIIDLDD